MRLALIVAAAVLTAVGCSRSTPAPVPAPAPTVSGPVIENQDYANWKKFPVGTVVKIRSVSARGKAETTSVETLKLLEVTDEKVVVERQNTTERNDGSYKAVNPPETRTYTRSFTVPSGMTPEDFAKPSLKAKPAGEETVKAAGKEYKAQVFRWMDGTEAGDMKVTVWVSDEMPGRVVRQVMIVAARETTTTDEVIEVVLK